MRLVRGWEREYLPERIGGLRLSKVSTYHDADDSEGIGDRREGEIRSPVSLSASIGLRDALGQAGLLALTSDELLEQTEERAVRELYQHLDDSNAEYKPQGDGHYLVKANCRVDSVTTNGVEASPYVLCMSREPITKLEWVALRESLPDTYSVWTITEDISRLAFEIECGIKRWLALNEVSEHRLGTSKGWIAYEYDEAPASSSSREDLAQLVPWGRWFRKGRRYQAQNEYRVLWEVQSPQMPTFPDSIDLELTRTGISLFRPWEPPSS